MGAGIATTPPPTGDALTLLLINEVRALKAVQLETNRLLQKEFEPLSPWMSDEEAGDALGFRTNPDSKQYKRKLSWCREKYHLKTFARRNPYVYDRAEVTELIRRIRLPDTHRDKVYVL